jgi:hypothetical protein
MLDEAVEAAGGAGELDRGGRQSPAAFSVPRSGEYRRRRRPASARRLRGKLSYSVFRTECVLFPRSGWSAAAVGHVPGDGVAGRLRVSGHRRLSGTGGFPRGHYCLIRAYSTGLGPQGARCARHGARSIRTPVRRRPGAERGGHSQCGLRRRRHPPARGAVYRVARQGQTVGTAIGRALGRA